MSSFDRFNNKDTASVWNRRGLRGWWRGVFCVDRKQVLRRTKWFRAEAEVDGVQEPSHWASATGLQP